MHSSQIRRVIQLCWFLVILLVIVARESHAYEHMSLHSRYMGDGWFRYDMTLHEDPFFHSYDNYGLCVETGGFVGFGSIPDGWQADVTTNGQVTVYTNTSPDFVARPLSATVWLQSSNTTYKTVESSDLYFFATCRFNDLLESPYGSQNIAYTINMQSIVPCPPEEADASPTNCFAVVEIFPNLRMDCFVISNGSPSGISFSWDSKCTALVSTSDDMVHWNDVEHFLFSPPQTDWIPSNELTSLGSFFRASIVSLKHKPELLSSTAFKMYSEPDASVLSESSLPLQIIITTEGVQVKPRVYLSEYYRIILFEDMNSDTPSKQQILGTTNTVNLPVPSSLRGKVKFITLH